MEDRTAPVASSFSSAAAAPPPPPPLAASSPTLRRPAVVLALGLATGFGRACEERGGVEREEWRTVGPFPGFCTRDECDAVKYKGMMWHYSGRLDVSSG